MSVKENKIIVRRFLEAFNEQDLEVLYELSAPEQHKHVHEQLIGGYKRFPGHHAEITDMVAEGDQVWVRASTSGGYGGGWMEIPASDIKWTNSGIFIFRLSGGKIVDDDMVFPTLGHLRQLGAKLVPPEGDGG